MNNKPKPIAVMFTDMHLSDDTVDVCKDIQLQCIILAKKLGISRIINGGDTFNTRKSQSLVSLNAFTEILDMYYDNDMMMLSIVGNHDKLDYSSAVSYMDAFKHHPSINLIRSHSSIESAGLYLLSFFSDDNQCTSNFKYIEKLKDLSAMADSNNGIKILITHHGIDGAKSNSGVDISSDICPSLFSSFDKVLVGHYHNGSNMSNKIIYTGSCRQSWFTENNHKGFTVIFDDGSTEFIKAKFKEYVEIDVRLNGDYLKLIDESISSLLNDHSDSYKRLHIIGDRASVRTVDIPRIKSFGIEVRTTDETKPVCQSDAQEEFQYVKFEASDICNLFMDFADEEGITDDNDLEYALGKLGSVINKQQ